MSILSFMIILLNIVFCDRGTSSPTIPSPDGGNIGGVTVIKNVTRKEGESVSFVCDVENEGIRDQEKDQRKDVISPIVGSKHLLLAINSWCKDL